MRVAMYYNNKDIRVEELQEPKIEFGELFVKVMASGICGSDVLEWYRIKKAPVVLGHEIAGEIVKVGKGVEKYKVGDRVFVSHHVPCNTCRYCLSGNHTVCETLHTTNFIPGGFSEYIRIPSINVEKGGVFVLPDEISYEEGTLIEPLACVIRGQRTAGLKKGQSVLILGSGISGLLHMLLAKASGAGRVIITDISKSKLNKALELGADSAINASEDVVSKLFEANEGRLADQVIVCAGAFNAFKQALECVDRAGTILFFASTDPEKELPIPVNKFWRNSIKMLTSYANSPEDAVAAIGMIKSGQIDVKKLITHSFTMSQAGEAFRTFIEDDKSIKVIIEPHK